MTTVRTVFAPDVSSSSAVSTTARRPDLQSGPSKILVIQPLNHLSAVLSGQSWPSLQRLGTTIPTFARVPAVIAAASWSTGTSYLWHALRSLMKYAHGLCLTAYCEPPSLVAQFCAIPS